MRFDSRGHAGGKVVHRSGAVDRRGFWTGVVLWGWFAAGLVAAASAILLQDAAASVLLAFAAIAVTLLMHAFSRLQEMKGRDMPSRRQKAMIESMASLESVAKEFTSALEANVVAQRQGD